MASIDSQIVSVGLVISRNIDELADDRGLLSQNTLAQLRNLVEAVALRLHLGGGTAEFDWALTHDAVAWVGSQSRSMSFLRRFHNLLQMSASHYTLEGDASERLMLSYFEYLVRTRRLVREQCGIEILTNLENFPIDTDPALRIYHEKIAERIDAERLAPRGGESRDRYYVRKVRPFFTGGRIYYEVTFSTISDRLSKLDRIIAFTDIDMTDRYASNLTLVGDTIEVIGRTMPITIIRGWEVSIRPCEVRNFAKIFGQSIEVHTRGSEYRELMRYLTDTGANLLDLLDMPEANYDHIRRIVIGRNQKPAIFPVLDIARQMSRAKDPGHNVMRYLMLEMNNRLIKLQSNPEPCNFLSNLRLTTSSGPFDSMPFCTSPRGHNPRFSDLLASINPEGRAHEFLAHRVKTNVERNGVLYTPLEELEDLGSVDDLIDEYNRRVYKSHTGRKLASAMNHVFLAEYEEGAADIVRTLQDLSSSGVDGYQRAVERWLSETQLNIDDEAKRNAMRSLFANSRIALIYGAAGTGKSTMVNYIANYFGDKQKLFLAQTNPAKDNLERRVQAQNTEFRTIASQIYRKGRQPEYDVLVIDECSIVSNADFLKVLANTSFKLLVLVGDVYQIEAIQFGNWFSIGRAFVPAGSVFELTTPYRTKNMELLAFWTRVRHRDDGIEESIAQHGYSAVLDQSLFEHQADNEIILCLNYDGLYGINNVNRFLQSSNDGKALVWGVSTYKVGDPVLFVEVDRFKPVIFNNLKGRIVDIINHPDRVQFDVWLDRSVTAFDVDGYDLRYVADSTVSFDVYPRSSTDEDDEPLNSAVPFQVAYAVSIHKAQGLEYDSVKLVVTNANEEDFSHSIFYTAITRARKRLRIFWTPETQTAILKRMRDHSMNQKDVAILSKRCDLAPAS